MDIVSEIDRIRTRAKTAYEAGEIDWPTLARIQTLCSNGDTAYIDGKPTTAISLHDQAAELLTRYVAAE